jgi:hypothetical protein
MKENSDHKEVQTNRVDSVAERVVDVDEKDEDEDGGGDEWRRRMEETNESDIFSLVLALLSAPPKFWC